MVRENCLSRDERKEKGQIFISLTDNSTQVNQISPESANKESTVFRVVNAQDFSLK